MNNITKFESSSSFEAASGGGTLAYPNTSLIEETNQLKLTKKKVVLTVFTLMSSSWNTAFNTYTFEENMTWREYFNSKYSKELDNYGEFYYGGTSDTVDEPEIWYEEDENGYLTIHAIALYEEFLGQMNFKGTCAHVVTDKLDVKLDDIIESGVTYDIYEYVSEK